MTTIVKSPVECSREEIDQFCELVRQGEEVDPHPGPYRFSFYSFDCNEAQHIHTRRERMTRKFWLEPIELAINQGFSARELNQIRAIIQEELNRIKEAWSEHCG